MLDISKPLSPSQCSSYYIHGIGSVYLPDHPAEWHGKLIETIGVSDPFSAEEFIRLMNGKCPKTGELWIPERNNPPGMMNRRGAYDFTFHADKTVSIAAFVGGDTRLIEAHKQAVKTALDSMEPFVQAALGGSRGTETTSKWATAIFVDDVTRPTDNYVCVHLHAHCIVSSMTEDSTGQARAIEPHALFTIKTLGSAIYQNEMGENLKRLGYQVEYSSIGSAQIVGFTPEYVASESRRSAEIKAELAHRGMVGPEAAERVAHWKREAKEDLDPTTVRAQHQANATAHGNQPQRVVAQARARGPQHSAEDYRLAFHAVEFAKRSLSERNSVFAEWEIKRDALRFAPGQVGIRAVTAEIQRQRHTGELVQVHHVKPLAPGPRYTTPELLQDERHLIQTMIAGKGTMAPVAVVPDETLAKLYPKLNEWQRKVVGQVLASEDRISGINGAAGTGKTFSMAVIRELAEREGYNMRGLAPTSGAARALRDAGIVHSETMQAFLTRDREHEPKGRNIFVLDESSLAATRQVNALLGKLRPDERVIFLGDYRQHSSLEAGRAFLQLQQAGMQTARVNKLVRQQNPLLKQVVEAMARGKTTDAVALLQEQGRIHVVQDRSERFKAIAKAYAAAPEGTLVVSPDNASRTEINREIRIKLREAGHLAAMDTTVTVLRPRQEVTKADLELSGTYRPGDVVKYRLGSKKYGIAAGALATVVSQDRESITVDAGGRKIEYDPRRLVGVNLYVAEKREFAVGDRLQFTSPMKEKAVANRDLGEVVGIRGHALRVKMDSGKQVRVDIRGPVHLDHGYTSTSFSSQSQTVQRALIQINCGDPRTVPLINSTLGYVAISRARESASIYTDDAAQLAVALSRVEQNSTALTRAQVMEYSAG